MDEWIASSIFYFVGQKRGELIKMWGTNKKKTERDGKKKM